ncbi:MAG: hypothetical protein ABWY12_11215 [Burkholderiales bacterium]
MSESREQLIHVLRIHDASSANHANACACGTGVIGPLAEHIADAVLTSDWYADHTFQLRRCNEARKQQLAELEALRAQVAEMTSCANYPPPSDCIKLLPNSDDWCQSCCSTRNTRSDP